MPQASEDGRHSPCQAGSFVRPDVSAGTKGGRCPSGVQNGPEEEEKRKRRRAAAISGQRDAIPALSAAPSAAARPPHLGRSIGHAVVLPGVHTRPSSQRMSDAPRSEWVTPPGAHDRVCFPTTRPQTATAATPLPKILSTLASSSPRLGPTASGPATDLYPAKPQTFRYCAFPS